MGERPVRYSVCACGAPLVSTFAWPQKEWVCLECGRLYKFFGGYVEEATDELYERWVALDREWGERFAPRLLTRGGLRNDCDRCGSRQGDHLSHATPEEIAADKSARTELAERWDAFQAREQPDG